LITPVRWRIDKIGLLFISSAVAVIDVDHSFTRVINHSSTSIHTYVTLRRLKPLQHTSSRKRQSPTEKIRSRRRAAGRDALGLERCRETHLLTLLVTRAGEDFTLLKGTRDDTDRLLEVVPSRSRHGNAVYPPRVVRRIARLRDVVRTAIILGEQTTEGSERVRWDGITHDRYRRLLVQRTERGARNASSLRTRASSVIQCQRLALLQVLVSRRVRRNFAKYRA